MMTARRPPLPNAGSNRKQGLPFLVPMPASVVTCTADTLSVTVHAAVPSI